MSPSPVHQSVAGQYVVYAPRTCLSSGVQIVYRHLMHLADYMQLRNLTDSDVAKRLGVDRATVSRIRRKKSRPDWLTIANLKRMSRGEITADDFTELAKEST